MQIDFHKSIKAGYLLQKWSLGAVLEYFFYAFLPLTWLPVTLLAWLIPTGYPNMNLLVALVLLAAVWAWYGRSLSLMHRLIRIESSLTQPALQLWLKKQFPHWYLEQQTHQLWCLQEPKNNYLYILITPRAIYANLYSLGRGGVPSPFNARANYKHMGQLKQALESERGESE
ncbi:hypothetical protein F0P96_18220 [Hymenobacter busanensis]|uniref:Uncharacterized protein n=1 Tax=Hymenobacter busanensis TaxID=2607656 RepID=A0A7L4ZRR3_9BACT|nr:hypothetical protein [Hymenobacter busanensis]KAA9327173.1 hypothetical protein F0P96_18220 [Hymenobacter busanensis]QHJ05839.1 hypothetical protein GUY19_00420 [Hymenobacter busanensis]